MEHFFPLNSSEHLRSDAHQSQIIGENADVNHTQTIGRIQSNYWKDISTIPRVSAPLLISIALSWFSVYCTIAVHYQQSSIPTLGQHIMK